MLIRKCDKCGKEMPTDHPTMQYQADLCGQCEARLARWIKGNTTQRDLVDEIIELLTKLQEISPDQKITIDDRYSPITFDLGSALIFEGMVDGMNVGPIVFDRD